jgi:hypothetical protein
MITLNGIFLIGDKMDVKNDKCKCGSETFKIERRSNCSICIHNGAGYTVDVTPELSRTEYTYDLEEIR